MKPVIQQAQDALRTGQFNQALTLLTPLKEQAGDEQLTICTLIAHAYMGLNELNNAIKFFTQGTLLSPESANSWADLGGAYFRNKLLDKAKECFEKALKINDNYAQVWHFLGLIFVEEAGVKDKVEAKNSIKQAMHCFNKAEQFDPFIAQALQAQEATKNNNHQQAHQLCAQILQRQPSHPQALFILAMQAAQASQLEQSAHYLNKGLAYSPYNTKLLMMQAQVYGQLRQYEAAIEVSRKLLILDGDSEEYALLHADNLVKCRDILMRAIHDV